MTYFTKLMERFGKSKPAKPAATESIAPVAATTPVDEAPAVAINDRD